MNNEISLADVQAAIDAVEHPEIRATLPALGMISDVAVNQEDRSLSFTLRLPMLGIPEQVRDYILQSVASAVQPLGVQGVQYRLEEMDESSRQAFFARAQAGWKG